MQIMASSPPPSHESRVQARVILGSPGVLSEQDKRLLLDVLSDCGADACLETLASIHRSIRVFRACQI
jgi:hypothetical protein